MNVIIISKNENQNLRCYRYDSIRAAKADNFKLDRADYFESFEFVDSFVIEHEVFNPDSRETYPNNIEERKDIISIDGKTRVYFFDSQYYRVLDVTEAG